MQIRFRRSRECCRPIRNIPPKVERLCRNPSRYSRRSQHHENMSRHLRATSRQNVQRILPRVVGVTNIMRILVEATTRISDAKSLGDRPDKEASRAARHMPLRQSQNPMTDLVPLFGFTQRRTGAVRPAVGL